MSRSGPCSPRTPRASSTAKPPPPRRRKRSSRKPMPRSSNPANRKEGVAGYVFLSPWLLGLLGITAIPMIGSLILSFTNYDLLSPWSELQWVGLRNYSRMFADDPHYWHAVTVTVVFALVAVPLKLAA